LLKGGVDIVAGSIAGTGIPTEEEVEKAHQRNRRTAFKVLNQ
jgi:hypothetical protein